MAEIAVEEPIVSHSEPKRRQTSEAESVAAFTKLLRGSAGADLRFIVEELQKGPAALTSHLASLLRDRVLHRALEQEMRGPASEALGRKLPEKCKVWKSVPLSLKLEFLATQTAEPLVWEAGHHHLHHLTCQFRACSSLSMSHLNHSTCNSSVAWSPLLFQSWMADASHYIFKAMRPHQQHC